MTLMRALPAPPTLAAPRLTRIAVTGPIAVLVAAAIAVLRTSTIRSPVIAPLRESMLIRSRIRCGRRASDSADEQQAANQEARRVFKQISAIRLDVRRTTCLTLGYHGVTFCNIYNFTIQI